MKLPPSKFFIKILIISFVSMGIISFIGNSYEKEILTQIKLSEASIIAKYIFVFLGSLVAISSITLFIRFFSSRAKNVAGIDGSEYSAKLEKQLDHRLLDRITLSVIFIIILGTFYMFYEIYIGAF